MFHQNCRHTINHYFVFFLLTHAIQLNLFYRKNTIHASIVEAIKQTDLHVRSLLKKNSSLNEKIKLKRNSKRQPFMSSHQITQFNSIHFLTLDGFSTLFTHDCMFIFWGGGKFSRIFANCFLCKCYAFKHWQTWTQ